MTQYEAFDFESLRSGTINCLSLIEEQIDGICRILLLSMNKDQLNMIEKAENVIKERLIEITTEKNRKSNEQSNYQEQKEDKQKQIATPCVKIKQRKLDNGTIF
jgi:hypothetical protein